jgi:hypothetical protein
MYYFTNTVPPKSQAQDKDDDQYRSKTLAERYKSAGYTEPLGKEGLRKKLMEILGEEN